MAVSRIVGEIEEKVTVREIGGDRVLALLTYNFLLQNDCNQYELVIRGDHNLDHHDN